MDTQHDFNLKTESDDWKDMVGKDWQIYKLKPLYTDSFVPVVYVDADERMASELVRRWNNFLALVDFLQMIVNGGINEAGEAQIEAEASALLETIKA